MDLFRVWGFGVQGLGFRAVSGLGLGRLKAELAPRNGPVHGCRETKPSPLWAIGSLSLLRDAEYRLYTAVVSEDFRTPREAASTTLSLSIEVLRAWVIVSDGLGLRVSKAVVAEG